uniref:BAG family molecular chaperone regulator 2 n=2 Tax=Cacopsylla melanoneura TaxID=428564 RepID=A0A8D9BV40_9HEMI
MDIGNKEEDGERKIKKRRLNTMEVTEGAFSVEEAVESDKTEMSLKDRLLSRLDQVEAHVEDLRKSAAHLEDKKDQILTSLHALRNFESLNEFDEYDREDILRYVNQISRRCKTVDVCVHTPRTEDQVDSLHQVNCLIDNLVVGIKDSPEPTRIRCMSYVSACSSYSSESDPPGDKAFETAVLGCALDDQKKIRQRLHGLLDYMTAEKWKQAIQPMD